MTGQLTGLPESEAQAEAKPALPADPAALDVTTNAEILRWLALGAMSLIFFTAPCLTLFNGQRRIFGLPLLLVYLFAAPTVLVGVSAWLGAKRR